MKIARRALIAFAAASTLLPGAVMAADFPSKTVRIIVGFAAGGGNDRIARLMAPHLSKKWGQPVVVENMEGAEGTIAADMVSKASKDGHVLLMMNTNQSSTPALRKLSFDPVKDFSFITIVAASPEVLLVHPSFEAKSVKELIDLAKKKPGAINFGSAGNGSPPFLEMARFMRATGIDLKPIPYKGSGAAMPALLGGEIQLMFTNSLVASGAIANGSLRGLSITGPERSPALPDMPTFKESAGIEDMADLVSWYGLAAPAGTPKDVVAKIYKDVVEVVKLPDVEKTLDAGGIVALLTSPEDTEKKIRQEISDFANLLTKYSK